MYNVTKMVPIACPLCAEDIQKGVAVVLFTTCIGMLPYPSQVSHLMTEQLEDYGEVKIENNKLNTPSSPSDKKNMNTFA